MQSASSATLGSRLIQRQVGFYWAESQVNTGISLGSVTCNVGAWHNESIKVTVECIRQLNKHPAPHLISVVMSLMANSAILEGFISSILAATFIAILVWAYNWFHNLRLERKLKDAINPSGVSYSFDKSTFKAHYSLQIHNYSNSAILVRGVVFICDKFHIGLHPDSKYGISQVPLSNEMTRKDFKRAYLSHGVEEHDKVNTMLLPSKTMGQWYVWPDDIGQREWIVEEIFIVFEYSTIFGNTALVRLKAPDNTLKLVKGTFEKLSRAAHNKTLFSEARVT